MHFKLIVAFVGNDKTEKILQTARKNGATGSTIISQARGEGIDPVKTFFGLHTEYQRDVILLLVEQHLSRRILESISKAGDFELNAKQGIAFQIDVEDAVGVMHQIEALENTVEEEL
jgi:hypothetical protein